MRVAITGASSVTGARIADYFRGRGCEVAALFTGNAAADYSQLQQERVASLAAQAHFGIRAEDGSSAAWIQSNRPDLWIHHHHYMVDFRSAGYDYGRAAGICLEPLAAIVEALAAVDCQRVVYSGTYFEEPRHDGVGDFRPYVVSKLQVWARLLELCAGHGIHLGKVVIPNVIDPLENRDRALPEFYRHLLEGKSFQLHAPKNIIDCLPAADLARNYGDIADRLATESVALTRPSGWVGAMGEWLRSANAALAGRLGKPELEICSPPRPPAGISYYNNESIDVDWELFWDQYVAEFDPNLK